MGPLVVPRGLCCLLGATPAWGGWFGALACAKPGSVKAQHREVGLGPSFGRVCVSGSFRTCFVKDWSCKPFCMSFNFGEHLWRRVRGVLPAGRSEE